MKAFAVVGYTKSGKTTTIEEIIKELRRRNFSVGSVKDIHFEQFAIDTEGTNTDRHKKAGSSLVTARGLYETDILFQEKLDIEKLASFYDYDYLILEGVREANVPMILTADCINDLEERYDERAFLVSGKIAEELDSFKGLQAISGLADIEAVVDIIEDKVFHMLPDYDPKCCSLCGYSCRELCKRIVTGKSEYSQCVVNNDDLQLLINGERVTMVPFVQSILKNTLLGVVKELDGYNSNASIEIKLEQNNDSK